jgi:hypothetical protein
LNRSHSRRRAHRNPTTGGTRPAEQIIILWRRGVTPRHQARLFADYARRRLALTEAGDHAAESLRG